MWHIHNSPFALLTRRRSEIIVESWIHLLIVRISIVSCAAVISHITNNKLVATARWSRKNCRRCWRDCRLFLSCLFLHRERLLVRTMLYRKILYAPVDTRRAPWTRKLKYELRLSVIYVREKRKEKVNISTELKRSRWNIKDEKLFSVALIHLMLLTCLLSVVEGKVFSSSMTYEWGKEGKTHSLSVRGFAI